MATPGQFVEQSMLSGYDQGHARKQALSDDQFKEKHNEIQGMVNNLNSQLAAVPEDARNTPDYLKLKDQLAQTLQERDAHWKSLDHPSAIMKFGKMLGKDLKFGKGKESTPVAPPVYGQPTMDVDGEKVPTGPAYKVQGPQTPAQMRAAAEASQLVAAAPLSPEQQALQGVNADSSKRLAQFKSDIDFHKSQNPHAYGPDATPEEKQMVEDYRNERVQYYGQGIKPIQPKEQDEYWTDVKGAVAEEYPKGSGNYRIEQVNKKGEHHWQDKPEGYTPQTPQRKPGTSALSIGLDSYAKSHGFSSFNDIPDDKRDAVMDYEIRKQALDKAMPQSTTTTTLKQDVNGQWVPVTETNYRTPGGNIKLVDPLGNAQSTPAASGEPPTTPKKTSGSKGAGTPSAPKESGATKTGNTKVGAPLFQGRTPAIAKAQNDIVDATKLASIADQVASRPNDAINQKRLAVQLERASAGRFTVQALDYVITSGWGNTLQQWANNPTTGALPPDIVRQLVDGAHENLTAAKESLKTAVQGIGGGNESTPNATGGRPKEAIGTVPHNGKNYWVDAQGNNLGVAP